MERTAEYQPNQSFIRLATACPEVAVSDIAANVDRIEALYQEASRADVSLVTFPESSITGYTIGDLVNQNILLEKARSGLLDLAASTEDKQTAMVVGLPLQVGNAIYNCAALLADGQVKGIVPKQHIPNYGEFYEKRWYQSWENDNTTVGVGQQAVPFGNELLFTVGGVQVGIEICEDAWVCTPPSQRKAEHGALIIVNPSASPEQIGKDDYRRNLVAMHSAGQIGAYVYAGCDSSESTMDIVMGGHQLIAANGQLLAEREPFSQDTRLLIQDIDVENLQHDRRREGFANRIGMLLIPTAITRNQTDVRATVERNPFLPDESPPKRAQRLERAVQIQAHGLAERMTSTRRERVVLGLSGGLDSTLALLVACETARIMGKQPGDIIRAITMPGPASSQTTQTNAQKLAAGLAIPHETIPIIDQVQAELAALGHSGEAQDITYENVQARARTSILFNYGNKEHCMVLGTGDLTEIQLGWCTYNADHMSHYNVNASIPKTMVRAEVEHLAYKPAYDGVRDTLQTIVHQLISPELVSSGENISQSSEDTIGPFELHDHFMPAIDRYGSSPTKIAYLANIAFADTYTPDEINKWLSLHLERFARNQFKRSAMPDGPKVGSVALSPRGDWRMPSDLPSAALWE